jgi:hypothetical protein
VAGAGEAKTVPNAATGKVTAALLLII